MAAEIYNIDDIEIEYDSLQEKHNELLIRLVSVSDVVLRESLQDEYDDLSVKMAEVKDVRDKAFTNFAKELANELLNDLELLYLSGKKKTDLQSLTKTLKIAPRLKIPASVKNRRELCFIANELKLSICLVDYEGIVYDIIGKHTEKTINLFVSGFSRINWGLDYVVV